MILLPDPPGETIALLLALIIVLSLYNALVATEDEPRTEDDTP